MFIRQKGNTLVGGEADIMCIIELPAGTFHVALFEERPLPGPVKPIRELDFIRLKSKMHHTTGAKTLEGAQEHAREMREQLVIEDSNVCVEKAMLVEDPVQVWMLKNWTTGERTLEEVIFHE